MPLIAEAVQDLEPPTAAVTASVTSRWRTSLLVLVCIELLTLFGPAVVWLLDRWTVSVWHNAHGIFVPLVAAWLAREELKSRPDLPIESSAWGFVLLVPALALHVLDAGMHTQLLSAVALFLAIPGLSLLLLGRSRTRLLAFPIAFLAFALPIPLAFMEPVHMVLRQIAAHATAALLPMFGVGVFREGTSLYTAAGVIGVGDACSGFSTLYASVTFAALLSYFASSWRASVLVLIAAPIAAVGANLLRVLALTLMVAWGHGWLLDTFVHPLSGLLTFALALPILFWLGERGGPVVQR